jgi:SAM-dependent methyltransferase
MSPGEKAFAHAFGTATAEYDRIRSGPPSAAVEWMVTGRISDAVELGSGTDHFSRRLAERISRRHAVEPDPRMRKQFARSRPGVTVPGGSAERIPLPGESVDAVFSTDTWHLFDPTAADREIARVPRPAA